VLPTFLILSASSMFAAPSVRVERVVLKTMAMFRFAGESSFTRRPPITISPR
jgi:hypothetical protein